MWTALCVLAMFVMTSASVCSTTLKEVLIEPNNSTFEWTTDEYFIPDGQKSGELNYKDKYNFCHSDEVLSDLEVKVDEFLAFPPVIQLGEDLKTVYIYRQPADETPFGTASITLIGHCYLVTKSL